MDEVFKALADPTRRTLLDELFRQDGQTLTALEHVGTPLVALAVAVDAFQVLAHGSDHGRSASV